MNRVDETINDRQTQYEAVTRLSTVMQFDSHSLFDVINIQILREMTLNHMHLTRSGCNPSHPIIIIDRTRPEKMRNMRDACPSRFPE